jgi:cell division protein FtsL
MTKSEYPFSTFCGSFIFITLLLLPVLYSFGNQSSVDSLLKVLDETIVNYKTYMDAREEHLNELKSLEAKGEQSAEQLYLMNNRIFNGYRSYNIDSAIVYLYKNLHLASRERRIDWEVETNLNLSYVFSASGLYKEAMDVIEKVNRNQIPSSLYVSYYSSLELLFSELANNTRLNLIAINYRSKATQYRDSVLQYLDKNSRTFLLYIEQSKFEAKELEECIGIDFQILRDLKPATPEYAMLTYRLARCYQALNNIEQYKKWLAISAISDIKAAVKDNASLNLLATQLYSENEIDRAYAYVKFALADANFFNARLRLVQVSNMLPLINEAFQNKTEKQQARLRFMLIIISLLVVFLIATVSYIYIQMRRLAIARDELKRVNQQLLELNAELSGVNSQMKTLNSELAESNQIKEQYIGLFLSICSSYIDKLENFRRMTHKMLASGKTRELLESTKSNQLVDNELNEFYGNFDNTFLHIFPNFVDDLNQLLIEEDRIVLKKGELLNTELRIFALIRLGISDSSKIAALLRYSVNTIYNYRVKMRNRAAINRDEFELRVMKIGSFGDFGMP